MSTRVVCVGFALVLASASVAAAAVQQPGGATIPASMGCASGKPSGLAATFACVCRDPGVCNIGAVCSAPGSCDNGLRSTCETTLTHAFNDNTCIPSQLSGLDPYSQASLTPDTFRPSCPLTFTVVTRGTAIFRNVFGWYNVTGQSPAMSDLHPMLDCNAATGASAVLDLVRHPDYRGGEIGFFIATPESRSARGTCAGGNCCATLARLSAGEGHLYFSQRTFNADSAGAAASIIHLLTYQSVITPRKFYFAWEDIYGGSNNDFTDFVTGVEGIECAGGGEACDTGRPGVCSYGVTKCQGAALACVPVEGGGAEQCDGLDNDCDGMTDDGATCPGATEVCQDGRCVPHCELDQEFVCALGLSCNVTTGLCGEAACAGVSCPSGQVCRGGSCVAPCQGVVCPHGQVCRADRCMDPCAGVSCGAGLVCAQGLCVPGCGQCGGVLCGAGVTCDAASGRCEDRSCTGGCAAGLFCKAGSCVDGCAGAVCPRGQACSAGLCGGPGGGVGGDGGLGGGDGGGGGGDGMLDEDPGAANPACGACAQGGVGGRGPGGARSAAVLALAMMMAVVVLAVRRRRR